MNEDSNGSELSHQCFLVPILLLSFCKYLINYKWTFKGNEQSKLNVAIKYCLVWCGSIALNTWGTAIGARILSGKNDIGLDSVLLSKVIVAVLVAVLWNFLMQKYFVFKKTKIK